MQNINLHTRDRYMGKTLYRKHLDAVGNIRVNLNSCVARELWNSTRNYFHHFPCEGIGKFKGD